MWVGGIRLVTRCSALGEKPENDGKWKNAKRQLDES